MINCPCCGTPMSDPPSMFDLKGAPLSRQHQMLVDAMIKVYPRSLGRDALYDVLYGDDPSGGPDNPASVVAVRMCQLRSSLRPFGWTVKNNRGGTGNYGRYRLEPVEGK